MVRVMQVKKKDIFGPPEWTTRVYGHKISGYSYPRIQLPAALRDWIGKKVKITYMDNKLIIEPLEE